ncbi:hypothetical protein GGF32_003671 [Allomyces javanicus]|nr:hypothetical protein GGF32_003671 [Allomyces javanicus]
MSNLAQAALSTISGTPTRFAALAVTSRHRAIRPMSTSSSKVPATSMASTARGPSALSSHGGNDNSAAESVDRPNSNEVPNDISLNLPLGTTSVLDHGEIEGPPSISARSRSPAVPKNTHLVVDVVHAEPKPNGMLGLTPPTSPHHSLPPGLLRVRLRHLFLNASTHSTSPFVRITIGDTSFTTFVRDEPDEKTAAGRAWHWDDKFDFSISYHSQLFSSIQLDVMDERVFIPDLHVGRAECRISSLSSFKTKLRLPIFHHRDAPSRRPFSHGAHRHGPSLLASANSTGVDVSTDASSTVFSPKTPVPLGFIETIVLYQPQSLDAVAYDKTIESLLSPHDVPNVGAAFLEGALRVVALSKTTRNTLGSVYRLLTVFGQGVDTVSPLEWVCGMLLLQRYFLNINQPRTYDTITDRSFFSSTLHFKKYATAAYGWRGLMFFGKSKIPSDKRSMAAHLPHVTKEDILSMELTSRDVFQPCYYVVRDRRENALVVTIRGTLSTMDAITDLVCEYSRMDDGLVHRGIKVAAEWLATTLDAPLRNWVKQFKPDKLVIVGHSLGAGTASLLTMLLADHQLPHLRDIQPTLQLKCFAFAPPPACSLNLARRYAHMIDSFVLDNDVVCRLSYGSVVDLRTSLLAAIAQVENHTMEIYQLLTKKDWNDNPSVQRKFDAITRVRAALDQSNINPKLFVAGTVYHIRHVPPEDVRRGMSPVDPDPVSETDPPASSGMSSSLPNMVRAMASPLHASGPFQFATLVGPRCSTPDIAADGEGESILMNERDTAATPPAASAADDRRRGNSVESTSSVASAESAGSVTRVPIIERSDPERFAHLAVKAGMFSEHLPIAYENALQTWLASDADSLGVDS